MSIDKDIILSPDILKKEEAYAVDEALIRLALYARAIPVAHYSKDPNDPNGAYIPSLDKNGDFFRESYSDMLIESQHTGRELAKMLKLFCSQKTSNEAAKLTLNTIWEWFTRRIPADKLPENCSDPEAAQIELDKDKYNYTLFVKAETNLLDRFTKAVDLFLRRMNIGELQKSVFHHASMYFDAAFRKNAEHEDLNYLLPRDTRIQNLMHTLSSTRNKKEHLDNSIFKEPVGLNEQFLYCQRIHLSMNFYILLIVSRFYDEFWDRLVSQEHIVHCSAIEEELQSLSKKLLKLFYIERVHKEAHARMYSLFHGTGILDRSGLLEDLPEILLRGKDKDGNEVIGDCVEMLVENQSSKRRLIIGEPGSGKSVMFTRMLQRDQPMATPFFFELKDFCLDDDSTPDEVVMHLNRVIEKRVIHEENITINKGVKNATVERIYELLDRGSAVFFIDSVDSAMANIPNLVRFIETYPECQYIIGTQPDAVPQELIDAGFITLEVLPLNDVQMKKIMKLASLHISKTDHTDLLDSKIRTMTYEMSRNPFTLLQIISLLESGSKKISALTNRSGLYWSIYWKIRTSSNLEVEEKNEILNRGFMSKFLEQVESICNLCSTVVNEFNAVPQLDWKKTILEFPMIQENNPTSLRSMFEIMEIIRLRYPHLKDDAHLFRTLVTSALLESGISSDSSKAKLTVDENGKFTLAENGFLPMPNPMLKKLASATATIQDNNKIQHQEEDDRLIERVVYKMQPRQIIKRYIMTLMNVYKEVNIDASKYQKQLRVLFQCVAYSGDSKLIDELFTPFWFEKWLMDARDIIHPFDFHGSAVERSPLQQILIKKCINTSHLALRLLQQHSWIHAWNMKYTKEQWGKMMRDLIVYEMNDEHRYRFFSKTDEKLTEPVSQEILSYYRNMTIVSMGNISLAHKYDYSNTFTYESEIYKRLIQHGDNTNVLEILLHLFACLLKKGDTLSVEGIFMHLTKHQPSMTAEQRGKLWTSMKDIATTEKEYVRYLVNKVAIEDIDEELALMIYDEGIYRHIISIKNREKEKAEKWLKDSKSTYNRRLYQDATSLSKQARRQHCKYTFYCQNNSYTLTLATECIDEMPEHKFCRIDNYDQWFYVEDVVVLGKEKNLNHIAEITLCIPNNAARERTGFITMPDGRHIPYIHMFQIRNSQQIVIRIDDQESIEWLMAEGTIESLKENRDVQLNDTVVTLCGVDIRIVDQNMRLLILTSVENPRFKGFKEYKCVDPKPVRIDFPHSGYVSFYHSKDPNSENNKKLLLKVHAPENVTTSTNIENSIYLGSSDNRHYIMASNNVSIGHVLTWSKSPFAGKVTKVCAMFGIKDIDTIGLPVNVVEQYKIFYFSSLKTAKKENISRNKLYNGSISVIEFELITTAKSELYTPGKLISEKISIQFYHPIIEPDPPVWRPRKYEVLLDSCQGTVTRIDNILTIRVPATEYPEELKYFHTDVLPRRAQLKWYKPQTESGRYAFIRLDRTIGSLYKEGEKCSVTFYSDQYGETAIPIRIERFSDLIDITKPKKYHPDIAPVLINEWVSEGDVDSEKQNFCRNRKYADLLVQLCKLYGVQLKDKKISTNS